ncbi:MULTISPECIES: hypothetical protein [Microbacterium]|uniref:UDP N-acetylglucosamine O-acyltransferase C-terminal domain-containing protein n=1 Tax=Microbacterium maritypicum MF109 TaxID=1333857 RepID=T5KKH9_MICMQ|nr:MULTISPECIES: hypothetical protein [Microbacterium]EQM76983.1 hypothetical protein L687_00710 [Microbacterium maritypicum MF109]NIG64813.1 acyl-ACP--UDP-N- acetylglucosamine O-acyltransferase [Microbacterium sp. Be9]
MNTIHPSAHVSRGVELGSGNVVGPGVVIHPGVRLGDDNWIGAGVVLGAPPEVRSFAHPRDEEDSYGAGLLIGSQNVIREAAQVHQGSQRPTEIGDGAFIMNQVYVAHDGNIGNGVTLASSVLLAGHVTVGERANLGLGVAVHQFRTVGVGAMVGMGSVVTADVPAFAKVYGVPARVVGANVVGMQRSGIANADAEDLDRRYRDGTAFDDVLSRLLG